MLLIHIYVGSAIPNSVMQEYIGDQVSSAFRYVCFNFRICECTDP